jgi:AraC-like DNA-binding protein
MGRPCARIGASLDSERRPLAHEGHRHPTEAELRSSASLNSPERFADLATQTGAWRSMFAARFNELFGEAQLTYVARWRLQFVSTTP